VHVPPTHDWPAEQALSQLPQLKTSVLRSTQLAAHIVCPGTLHVVEQVPAEHTCPARHATPHAPQLSASVAGFVQAPLHWVSPTWHSQAPAMHDWPVTQTTPQAPQWLESMLRSTQAEAHRVWPVWQPAVVPSTPTCALPPVAPGRRVSVRSEQLHATRTSAAILATMGRDWDRARRHPLDCPCLWCPGQCQKWQCPRAPALAVRRGESLRAHRRAPACLGASVPRGAGSMKASGSRQALMDADHDTLTWLVPRVQPCSPCPCAVALESRVALLRTWFPIELRKPELSFA
jgi:hypothetical protein